MKGMEVQDEEEKMDGNKLKEKKMERAEGRKSLEGITKGEMEENEEEKEAAEVMETQEEKMEKNELKEKKMEEQKTE